MITAENTASERWRARVKYPFLRCWVTPTSTSPAESASQNRSCGPLSVTLQLFFFRGTEKIVSKKGHQSCLLTKIADRRIEKTQKTETGYLKVGKKKTQAHFPVWITPGSYFLALSMSARSSGHLKCNAGSAIIIPVQMSWGRSCTPGVMEVRNLFCWPDCRLSSKKEPL